jgi:hypothetical protein
MPVIAGVGNSDYTAEKQAIVRGIMRMHLRICQGIFTRYPHSHNVYQYIDMNAGYGDGSPSIFYDEICQLQLPFNALLVDTKPDQITHLHKRFAEQGASISIIQGDHNEVVVPHCRSWKRPHLGLCYHDPNGEVSWEALADIAAQPRCAKLDILVNMSATAQKRIRLAAGDRSKLDEYLNTIEKKYWLIRKPYGNWQWTFLIGTNWSDFPRWKKEDIYDLNSTQGQEIFEKLAMTTRERFETLQPRFEGF